jgi:very-short-patch-repair endonuclease/predicted transcriptional regulator of viral defense system
VREGNREAVVNDRARVNENVKAGEIATTAQLMARGISRSRLGRLVRDGELIQLRQGVYVTASALARSANSPGRTHALYAVAALLPTKAIAVASHESAALLHGIDLLNRRKDDNSITLTRALGSPGSRSGAAGITVHVARLPREHKTRCYGVPVTTAPRTVADLGRSRPFINGVVAADSALHAMKATRAELDAVLAACASWPGIEAARRVVEFSDPRAESALESCARVIFREHALPAPELQAELFAERPWRADFYWPQYGTVAEADGLAKYEDTARAISQLERDKALRAAGFKVVHFTWDQLFRETDRVIGWIRQAFASPSAW